MKQPRRVGARERDCEPTDATSLTLDVAACSLTTRIALDGVSEPNTVKFMGVGLDCARRNQQECCERRRVSECVAKASVCWGGMLGCVLFSLPLPLERRLTAGHDTPLETMPRSGAVMV